MRLSCASIIMLAALTTACTRMEQFYPEAEKTVVDGEEFVVRKQGEGNYLAIPNDPSRYNVMTVDARAASKNVRAIEQVTGCKVITESIQNRRVNTIAAVRC